MFFNQFNIPFLVPEAQDSVLFIYCIIFCLKV